MATTASKHREAVLFQEAWELPYQHNNMSSTEPNYETVKLDRIFHLVMVPTSPSLVPDTGGSYVKIVQRGAPQQKIKLV